MPLTGVEQQVLAGSDSRDGKASVQSMVLPTIADECKRMCQIGDRRVIPDLAHMIPQVC